VPVSLGRSAGNAVATRHSSRMREGRYSRHFARYRSGCRVLAHPRFQDFSFPPPDSRWLRWSAMPAAACSFPRGFGAGNGDLSRETNNRKPGERHHESKANRVPKNQPPRERCRAGRHRRGQARGQLPHRQPRSCGPTARAGAGTRPDASEGTVTVMPAEREPCAFCGAQDWVEARYTCGRLICSTCLRGSKPVVPQPTSEAGRRAIQLWLAPRPPKPPALNLAPATQRQGASRG
jgi:hypothetical protein